MGRHLTGITSSSAGRTTALLGLLGWAVCRIFCLDFARRASQTASKQDILPETDPTFAESLSIFAMKILVCISQVPDTTTKINFKDNDTAFNEAGVLFIANPYDEWYALVRAVELKESTGGEVTVINVGPAANEQVIRKCLAICADKAIRVDTDPKDALYVARQIAAHAGDADMVLLGKETIDYNGSVLGGMIAELLGRPYISLSSKLEVDGDKATITRDTEGGKEILSVAMPFVASAQKGMAEARIPNMRGIMQARSKPLEVVAPIAAEAGSRFVKFELPPAKGAVTLVDPENMDELVRMLHEDAKVI